MGVLVHFFWVNELELVKVVSNLDMKKWSVIYLKELLVVEQPWNKFMQIVNDLFRRI